MTDDRMTLIESVEKEADADLVREMLAFAAERIMEAEVEAVTGAAKHARTPVRETSATAIATGSGRRAPAEGNDCVVTVLRRRPEAPRTLTSSVFDR